ncbi:DEAD/DEAH box helicase [Raoultibacter phocaeensis]|uniref:DEAD/DEAH box helicase n=1 Tax=Raoultibacter phocaeensis TaxID=2479841 RepID=UPI0021071FFC|nr:DEAD/DEAH box helicase family protein [Raoultibacter phocaeensis]
MVAANLIARRKTRTLILVLRATLLEQWQQRLLQFLDIDEELPELLTPTGRLSKKKRSLVGQIGGGKRLPSGILDVALVPALFEKGELSNEKRVADIVQQYGMVICDECHHVPAFSFEQIMRSTKARYVYGLTATPKRADGLQAIAFMQCGPIRYRAEKTEDGELSFSRIMIPRFTKSHLDGVDPDNYTQIVEALSLDAARNDLIVRDVVQVLDRGGTPLVLTKRVDHAVLLEESLRAKGRETVLLVGSDPQKLKREKLLMLERIESGKSFAIVATGSYIGRGSTMIALTPYSLRHR